MSTLDIQEQRYEHNSLMSKNCEIFAYLDPDILFKRDKLMFKACGFSKENSVVPYFDYMELLDKHSLECETLMENSKKFNEIPSVKLSELKKDTDPLVQETISKILNKYPDISYEEYLECLKAHILKCKNIHETLDNMKMSDIDNIQNFVDKYINVE